MSQQSALATFSVWLRTWLADQACPAVVEYPAALAKPGAHVDRIALRPAGDIFGPQGWGAASLEATAPFGCAAGFEAVCDGRSTTPGAGAREHIEAAREVVRLLLVGLSRWALTNGHGWDPGTTRSRYELPADTGAGCRIIVTGAIREGWHDGPWIAAEPGGSGGVPALAAQGELVQTEGTTEFDRMTVATEL